MTKNFTRAMTQAKELRRLAADGRYAEADQCERTIDDLVGTWDEQRNFVWPTAIANIAGVPARRKAHR